MNNAQLYFAIGVPTFTVLLGIVAGFYQNSQLNMRLTGMDNRISQLENWLDNRMSVIESDIKTLVRIIGDMDSRIARLEERTAR